MPWNPLPSDGSSEPTPVGASLERVVRYLGAPTPAATAGLHDRWAEIVGERVAAHATPGSVREGALRVYVDDPAWASQLRFLEPTITRRVAEVLGADVVDRVEVRVAGPPRREGHA